LRGGRGHCQNFFGIFGDFYYRRFLRVEDPLLFSDLKLFFIISINKLMLSFSEFFLESVTKKVDIEYLLPDKNNMEIAVDSLKKGMRSMDNKPIEVYRSEDKYIVADGHHRLLQSIINGEASVIIKVLDNDKPMSRNGTIELDFYSGDYYGLDETLENGWLIKRL
jgi:hypothetical protein